MLIKLYVLIIILVNQLFFTEVKMQCINLLKQLLKTNNCKNNTKKHFNENLFISVEDEKRFQSSN